MLCPLVTPELASRQVGQAELRLVNGCSLLLGDSRVCLASPGPLKNNLHAARARSSALRRSAASLRGGRPVALLDCC